MRRCVKCRTSALPSLDLCLLCSQAELAGRARDRIRRKKPGPKKRAKQNRMPCVSVRVETYEALRVEAERRGVSVRAIVEEACRGV